MMNRRLFGKRFATFVISLERTPERLSRFFEWNRDADIDVNVFKAVDGRTLDLANLDPTLIAPGTTTYSPGSIGSAMSHRALWQSCADGDRPFLIFEDDAAIRGDFRAALPSLLDNLGKSWEMLVVGYNVDAFAEVAVVDDLTLRFGFPVRYPDASLLTRFTAGRGPVGLARVTNFFGLCGYLVSPSGAQSLLRLCFPLDGREVFIPAWNKAIRAFTLDTRINAHLRSLQAYACLPPLVMPDNATSTKA